MTRSARISRAIAPVAGMVVFLAVWELLVRVNDSLKRPTPDGIRKIAEARLSRRPGGTAGPALAQP